MIMGKNFMETINVSFPYVSFSKWARCAVPNLQMYTRCIFLTLSLLLSYAAFIFTRWLYHTVTHFFSSILTIPIVVFLLTTFFLYSLCVYLYALSARFFPSINPSSSRSFIIAVSHHVCIWGYVHPVLHSFVFRVFALKWNFW